MHRISILAAICGALVCGYSAIATAGRVMVSVDLHARNTPVTLTVRDADVTDVLSAVFNATDNRYQLQTGVGIAGKIDTLQLTQTPFDDALKAILVKTDPSFTFSKAEGGIYRIMNPTASTVVLPGPTLYVPVKTDDTMVTVKATLPIIVPKNNKNTAGGKATPAATPATPTEQPAPDSLLSDSDTSGVTPGKEAAKPTTEECYLAMIKIRNQPVHVFAVGFGADELPDFSTLSNPGGTSGIAGNSYNGMSTLYNGANPYGTATPYGTNSPYGTTSPYGTNNLYGSSYPYGTTTPYASSYPYGVSTVAPTVPLATRVVP